MILIAYSEITLYSFFFFLRKLEMFFLLFLDIIQEEKMALICLSMPEIWLLLCKMECRVKPLFSLIDLSKLIWVAILPTEHFSVKLAAFPPGICLPSSCAILILCAMKVCCAWKLYPLLLVGHEDVKLCPRHYQLLVLQRDGGSELESRLFSVWCFWVFS